MSRSYAFVPTADRKINLSSDGKLEVSFLGIGAAFASTMYQSNLFVVKGDNHVMIDLGSKASVVLQKAGISVLDIENLIVTHSHADHIGGVEEWCLKARYMAPFVKGCKRGEYKPNMLTTEVYAQIIWNASLRGGLEYSEETKPGQLMSLDDYVNVVTGQPLDGYGRPVFGLTVGIGKNAIDIKLMRTNHVPDSSRSWQTAFYSVGVLIDERILLSGDTMFDHELLEVFGKDAEIIFHDCQEFKGGVHASYPELCELPDDIKAKMILYHLTDGIREKFNPVEDGFLDWVQCFKNGKYVFE